MTDALWTPSEVAIKSTHLYALMQAHGARDFAAIHAWAAAHREAFWQYAIEKIGIKFRKSYAKLLDLSEGIPHAKWLVGAEMNIAESCFQGDLTRIAIITKRNDGRMERITLAELDVLSNRIANGLAALGIKKGDSVAIDMAMTAEAVASYLGVVKLGAACVSIPDSFPPEEIAKRLRIGNAKILITQDAIKYGAKTLPMYEKCCAANAPKTVMYNCAKIPDVKLRPGDVYWKDFLSGDDRFTPVSCSPDGIINILFSSGTTGDPKAIPWLHATAIKCASDAYFHHDIRAGEVVCWPTSLGWMMGPWLIFATLLNRATIALYEGAPVERGFCEFVADAKVNMLGLVPAIVKGWRKGNMTDRLDWSCVRAFSSSGEASNADDYGWLMQTAQAKGVIKPVVEYCGGTEIAGGYVTSNLVSPQRPAEFNGKTMGLDFVVLVDDGKPVADGEMGEVFIVPPSIGLSTRLLNADNDKVYYTDCPSWQGHVLRRHGDRLIVRGPQRFQSDGRADNTMNLGGIKVSSAEIERTVHGLKGVVETAAIGIPPKTGGADRLVIYTVAERGAQAASLKTDMQKAIKEKLNPLFHVHEVIIIEALPRTASNKVMHRELRKKYQAEEAA